MTSRARTYVLDTNVLIHDPAALYRFAEHDVFIPMIVLEELDAIKKGVSEVARNARQASRMLDEAIGASDADSIARGLALGHSRQGRLFLQTSPLHATNSALLAGHTPDNSILQTALALREQLGSAVVTLVSKDINLRIKARVLGLPAEDYTSDKVLDDVDLLYSGVREIEVGTWESLLAAATPFEDAGVRGYRLERATLPDCVTNEFITVTGAAPSQDWIVTAADETGLNVLPARDYRAESAAVWGVRARNTEQSFALNLLLDPAIDFVSLVGAAGTGKTLLALAAGLAQCLDMRRYKEIVVTRITIPVGEDIGFLPGTEEEKMTPWMGALVDNLEFLSQADEGGEWGRRASADFVQQRIKIRSLNFMRGRTFLNRYVIIDEAQNLTPKQMKTLITRAGPGSKFVCLGNLAQIDSPYLSETSCGLTYVIDRFRPWPYGGHIRLQRGERSRLADFASAAL